MRMEEIVEETNGNPEKMVEITLKTIGPAHPSRLHVLSSIRVLDLKKVVARNNCLPVENLKLKCKEDATQSGPLTFYKVNSFDEPDYVKRHA